MGDVSDNKCRDNQTTRFMFNDTFSRKSCPIRDIMELYRRPQFKYNTLFAICMSDMSDKNTDTQVWDLVLITFSSKQMLRERASVLLYM
jgi:hypothetical protein